MVRKNFGGNIFGGKSFGDFLPNFGVIFGESPQNFGDFLPNIWLKFGEIKDNFDVNQTKKSTTLILSLYIIREKHSSKYVLYYTFYFILIIGLKTKLATNINLI